MTPTAELLSRIFTSAAPCCGCRRTVPTFRDRETGRCYCLPCLEDAVTESQAEIAAERQDMAMVACLHRQIAA